MSDRGLFGRLSSLLFPYCLNQYPGRVRAMSELLGYTCSSVVTYSKPAGDARLTLAGIERAEKIIERYERELAEIKQGLRALREKNTPAKTAPRGFRVVRVRDETGIPRNASGHGKGNAPGF